MRIGFPLARNWRAAALLQQRIGRNAGEWLCTEPGEKEGRYGVLKGDPLNDLCAYE